MKYLALIYRNSDVAMTPEIYEGYRSLTEELGKTGAMSGGSPVEPASSGSCIRRANGKTSATHGAAGLGAHDLVGFYLLDCKCQMDAQDIAARIPDAAHGFIEVRPLLQH